MESCCYKIYTDGSCKPSKSAGGIGVVWIRNDEKVFEFSKGYKNVTNNIMELTAIYVALKSIKKEINSLEIVSDSQYAIGCITNPSWNPKKNIDLINACKRELKRVQGLVTNLVEFVHVKGHSSDKWNNYCDNLAQKAADYVLGL